MISAIKLTQKTTQRSLGMKLIDNMYMPVGRILTHVLEEENRESMADFFDQRVSFLHGTLFQTEEGVYYIDHSTNGTWYKKDGIPVNPLSRIESIVESLHTSGMEEVAAEFQKLGGISIDKSNPKNYTQSYGQIIPVFINDLRQKKINLPAAIPRIHDKMEIGLGAPENVYIINFR